MELGNMLFGNSRGECPINRDLQDEFQERVLYPLGFDSYGNPEDELPAGWSRLESWGYTNGVFTLRPYWWGDCQCGWDELVFEEGHAPDCYQTRLQLLRGGDYSQRNWRPYEKARTRLCREMNLDPRAGCEVHCTCDFNQRYSDWFEVNKLGDQGHADDCPLVLPNFECHPLGLTIKVYKYFLRDSYSNLPLDGAMLDRLQELVS